MLSGEIVAAVAGLAVVDGITRTRAPHSVILDILTAFLAFLNILCATMDIPPDELGILWMSWSMTLLRNSSIPETT